MNKDWELVSYETGFLGLLKEMLELQNKLNCETTKTKTWHNKITGDGMPINWYRYIKLEASELAESFPVKHWKDINKPIDYRNVKMELIDIWHFLLSKIIELYSKDGTTFKYKKEDLLRVVCDNRKLDSNLVLKKEENTRLEDTKTFLNTLSEFEYVVSLLDSFKNAELEIENISSLFKKFFVLTDLVGLDDIKLHNLYLGKNCLNKFRLDNGYKTGAYKKLWNGVEDNVVLASILDEVDNVLSLDEIYDELQKAYFIN